MIAGVLVRLGGAAGGGKVLTSVGVGVASVSGVLSETVGVAAGLVGVRVSTGGKTSGVSVAVGVMTVAVSVGVVESAGVSVGIGVLVSSVVAVGVIVASLVGVSWTTGVFLTRKPMLIDPLPVTQKEAE